MTHTELNLTLKNANLQNAIETLSKLEDRKADYVVSADRIYCSNGRIQAAVGKHETLDLEINDVALGHISQKLSIPLNYLKACRESLLPLFDRNVNGWLGLLKKPFFLRSYLSEDSLGGNLEGVLRAFLSDRYFTYDNFDLLKAVLGIVKRESERTGLNVQVADCDLSERRFFVRFTCPDIYAESEQALKNYRAPGGDKSGGLGLQNGIITGFILSNSEVGAGSLKISPRVTILQCRNGMIWNDEGFKRTHLGAQMEQGEIAWSDRTQQAFTKLLEEQIHDVITRYLSPEFLAQRVADIEAMAAHKLEHPTSFVRNISNNHFGMTEEQSEKVFDYFIEQASSRSLFDAAQAITYFAQHDASPDLRAELETGVTSLLDVVAKHDVKKVSAIKVSDN